jgi:predicted ABC-type transport system involved in lysophospholipase L1 biosynthesis ATPase subunit
VTASAPLVSLRGVVKNYQALRPLRIEALSIAAGDIVSIAGVDAAAAELFVGLVTGALLPDSGDVELFGRSTRDVADSDAWLAMLDGVGIITDRAVLIAQFSVEQNLAMPFTLEIDPVAAEVRPRVVALAEAVGLTLADLATPIAEARTEIHARVRVARALALEPRLLLAEHPSASLPRSTVKAFAADLVRVATARGLAVVALTADQEFASALGGERLTLEPATGRLRYTGAWRKLFGRS